MEVLYIMGMGRSGSTLLDRLLNGHRDVVSLGEADNIWRNGPIEGRRCACGAPFGRCEFWSEVSDYSSSALSEASAQEVLRTHDRYLDSRQMWRVLTTRGRRSLLQALPASYLGTLADLYAAVAEVSGARTIVDSSKHPVYAFLLSEAGATVRLLHLVRDPRAVAYSWMREVVEPGTDPPSYVQRYSPLKAAVLWNLINASAGRVAAAGPPSEGLLRYEDLVDHPDQVVARLLASRSPSPVDDREERIDPGVSHAMSGNPMRFMKEPITVRPDDEWRHGLARRERGLVKAITSPLRLRYGYR